MAIKIILSNIYRVVGDDTLYLAKYVNTLELYDFKYPSHDKLSIRFSEPCKRRTLFNKFMLNRSRNNLKYIKK